MTSMWLFIFNVIPFNIDLLGSVDLSNQVRGPGYPKWDWDTWKQQNKRLLERAISNQGKRSGADLGVLKEVPWPVPFVEKVTGFGVIRIRTTHEIEAFDQDELDKLKDTI